MRSMKRIVFHLDMALRLAPLAQDEQRCSILL